MSQKRWDDMIRAFQQLSKAYEGLHRAGRHARPHDEAVAIRCGELENEIRKLVEQAMSSAHGAVRPPQEEGTK